MPYAPYAHQVEAFNRSRDMAAFAYLMGMRTGKTKVTIDDWMDKVSNRHVDDLVVVAPAGTYRVWETELQKHVLPGFEYDFGIWDSSAGVQHKRALWDLARSRGKPRALVVNIEALSAADTNEVKQLLFELMKTSRQRTFMAVDESTGIKNPTSGRTFTCAALGQLAPIRRILTGLPTPRSPLDAYGQFAFLDPRILGFVGRGSGHERFVNGYNKFYAHHAVTRNIKVGARWQRILVGYEHEDEIRQKILPYSYRKTLRECSDVPVHAYKTREVELTPQQRKAYAEMKAYFITQLESGETITAQQVVTMQLKLHQICCGHVTDQFDVRHEVKTNRPQALYELLREYDGKAVIWCSYDWDVRLVTDFLREKFGEQSVVQFWGGNRSTREEDNRRFKEDPECLYLVATPSAGGRGRNWSEADLMVYYSNTDNLEHRDQSEERGSDMNKTQRVTVVDFITRGTVEEKIVRNLRGKIDMAASITGDDWREWVV